jgi:hypothetical protein
MKAHSKGREVHHAPLMCPVYLLYPCLNVGPGTEARVLAHRPSAVSSAMLVVNAMGGQEEV